MSATGRIITLYEASSNGEFRGSYSFASLPVAEPGMKRLPSPQAFRFGDWALPRFSIKVAVVCLAVAGVGFLYIGLPILWAEVLLRLSKLSEERILNVDKSRSHVLPNASPSPTPMYPLLSGRTGEGGELYRFRDFRLIIPKINLESVVVPNVDPSNPGEYREQLLDGVAHAKGSYMPGEGGTVFLFAHSTDTIFNIVRYNAKFYSAKELEIGDELLIEYAGKTYKYIVSKKMVIDPKDLGKVRNSSSDLILSTCYPPGTDWQRLVVFAELVIDSGK